MNSNDECLELAFVTRTSKSLERVISDREGPLGVDTTFRGCLYVYLLDEPMVTSLSVPEPDDLLARSLEKLAKRHPGRQVRLVRWDATPRSPKTSEVIRKLGAKIAYTLRPMFSHPPR